MRCSRRRPSGYAMRDAISELRRGATHGQAVPGASSGRRPVKLSQQTFETAIIERYRRPESPVEEAPIEMYHAGVSVRQVEHITEALWGPRVCSNRNDCVFISY